MLDKVKYVAFTTAAFLFAPQVFADNKAVINDVNVSTANIGFAPPNLATILSFAIRLFFVIAGIFALLYLLLGAFAWVTSGGNKENVEKAQQKIQAAIIGVILIVAVLAIVVTLEQAVFGKKICFGISCDIQIPSLVGGSAGTATN